MLNPLLIDASTLSLIWVNAPNPRQRVESPSLRGGLMQGNGHGVSVGDMFLSTCGEIRKVVRLVLDAEGRQRVHFQCKRATATNQPFLFPHSPNNAPYLEDFVSKIARLLTQHDIRRLRHEGVLLDFE